MTFLEKFVSGLKELEKNNPHRNIELEFKKEAIQKLLENGHSKTHILAILNVVLEAWGKPTVTRNCVYHHAKNFQK